MQRHCLPLGFDYACQNTMTAVCAGPMPLQCDNILWHTKESMPDMQDLCPLLQCNAQPAAQLPKCPALSAAGSRRGMRHLQGAHEGMP